MSRLTRRRHTDSCQTPADTDKVSGAMAPCGRPDRVGARGPPRGRVRPGRDRHCVRPGLIWRNFAPGCRWGAVPRFDVMPAGRRFSLQGDEPDS